MHTASGAIVDLFLDAYRGELLISPCTMRYVPSIKTHVRVPSSFERVAFTVSLGRPAAHIARAMETRGVFASAIAADLALTAEANEESSTRNAQRTAIDTLNKSGLLKRPAHDQSDTLAYWHTEGEARGSIQNGSVRLDAMTLTPEQALRVLRALAE